MRFFDDKNLYVKKIKYTDVFCTEYESGAKVYVNYTGSDYTLPDGKVVGAMNYLVVG